MKKIYCILIILILDNLNAQTLITPIFNSESDTLIITDDLIINTLRSNKNSNILRLGATVASFPFATLTYLTVHNVFREENVPEKGQAALFIASFPITVNRSVYDIQKHNTKNRLVSENSDKLVIDRSSISGKSMWRYAYYIGTNYTKFQTQRYKTKPKLSFGVSYSFTPVRFFTVSSNFHISYNEIQLLGRTIISENEDNWFADINYKITNIYCPIFIGLNLPIYKSHQLHAAIGIGFPYYINKSSFSEINNDEEATPIYHNSYDNLFHPYNMQNTYKISYSNKKYFLEYVYTFDNKTKNHTRAVYIEDQKDIFIKDLVKSHEILFGFYIN